MRKPSKLFLAAMSCLASAVVLLAGGPKPTKETVLALANKHRKVCEAKLDFKSKQIIEEINRRLASTKGVPAL